MSSNFVDVLVIGGGVIGLAIAKNFAAKGREVIVLEKEIPLVLLPVQETAESFMQVFIMTRTQ